MNSVPFFRTWFLVLASSGFLAPASISAYSILPQTVSNSKRVTLGASESSSLDLETEKSSLAKNRREFFSVTLALVSPFLVPKPSDALQSRNEQLCGTGLFEHFQEYRCTSIGNILDEGATKELSTSEKGATDSLMGKLGVSIDDLDFEVQKDSSKREKSKEKKSKKE